MFPYCELNIERLQARLTDKLDGDKLRFIIRVGLSNKILIDVENNTMNFFFDHNELKVLADFYGVSMDYIVGRTDNPEINR